MIASAPSTQRDARTWCGIAVMAKASKPGRTKTRLCPPLTPSQAAALNTAFLRDIAANLMAAAEAAPITGYMAYGPPGEGRFFDILPKAIGRFEAWEPNFGRTLAVAIDQLFALGHGAACVLNADSPTLPTAVLIETAEVLARPGDRAVMGPACDGGYYLLGLKTAHLHLFEDIAWSTEVVARQTLERAADIALPVHLLPEWYDIDDAAGLARLAVDGGDEPTLAPSAAHHTRALLAQWASDVTRIVGSYP